jgi:thioredoxin reductase
MSEKAKIADYVTDVAIIGSGAAGLTAAFALDALDQRENRVVTFAARTVILATGATTGPTILTPEHRS